MSLPPLTAAYRSLIYRGRLSRDADQAALVKRLAALQSDLLSGSREGRTARGLYIHGGVGTGKSRIADLFSATLPEQISRRRTHFHDFMSDIHARQHVIQRQIDFCGDGLVQIGRDVSQESKVLVFDEFQVTDIADAMILKRLFGAIWDNGGVLVSTSNREPERLYENGLNRDLFLPFISDIHRHCEVWKLPGKEDYRMRPSAQEDERQQTFFLDAHAFERHWHEQLGDARTGPASHQIMVGGGRSLDVFGVEMPRGKLLVKASFENLCKANRGSADYSALCRQAEALFISGLRKFAKDELDIVRRFIILIDMAYERRVRVICLSHVPLIEMFAEIVGSSDVVALGNHVGSHEIDAGSAKTTLDGRLKQKLQAMTVKGEGGSSSSMMSTYIGDTEWSATGLAEASLATGGAGETDVRFAVGRAVSRLFEMGSSQYAAID